MVTDGPNADGHWTRRTPLIRMQTNLGVPSPYPSEYNLYGNRPTLVLVLYAAPIKNSRLDACAASQDCPEGGRYAWP